MLGSDDVYFLYPDAPTTSTWPSIASSQPSLSYGSQSTRMMRDIALQLQTLVHESYHRHGTNHLVFQFFTLKQQVIRGLLSKNIDDAVDGMIQANGSPRWLLPNSSSSSVSSAVVSLPSKSSEALCWSCACGKSLKITSSKSIQKHRTTCVVNRAQQHPSDHHSAEPHTSRSHEMTRTKRMRH